MIDNNVIQKAQQGDIGSFKTIYNYYAGLVYRVVWGVLKNEHDAQEVMQDVFLKVHEQLEHFRFDASLKTWICRIAMNHAINYHKKHIRYQKYVDQFEQEEKVTRTQPDHHAEQEDKQRMLNKVFDLLAPKERQCIVLRNSENMSYDEIATTLDMNINTVRTHLRRARQKILEAMDQIREFEYE